MTVATLHSLCPICTVLLHTMEHLPAEVHKHFRAHEHTMHHTPSLFNDHGSMVMVQWSDMAIETTYM